MPIKFDQETRDWYLDEPTHEEKEALVNYAVSRITAEFGDNIAEQLMQMVVDKRILEATNVEEMGQA